MVIVLALASSGLETWTLVDVDGVEHAFSSEDEYLVTAGTRSRAMPGVSLVTDPVPFRAGVRMRRANVDERIMPVPVLVSATTYLQGRERIAQLAGWTDPARGDIAWRVTRPDATRRELVCRYRGGLDDLDGPKDGGLRTPVVVEVLASDPHWQDLADTEQTWTVPVALGSLVPVILPIVLPSSSIFVLETIDNSGYDRQDAWPVWTLTGPGANPVVMNLTSGKSIAFSRTLATGDRIIIDTRPGVKSVTDGRGGPVPTLPGSTLWALRRGLNQVQVEMAGAVVGASSVSMSYRRKFLGP